ncbi:MAG: glycine cleavage system aminomethyltransferase GcvT [Elusimicrobia bacterium]|nr:glycine cleavage system aminomethyltransferase GcvT [Elusimicrobiota bacterium]
MTSAAALRTTPLHQIQKEAGARFVDFHGWSLPVQFSGIIKEHQAVRGACGLFDVSHMGQVWVTGKDALALVQKTNANDAAKFKPGQSMYSHMLNERGGVVDDVIVTVFGPERFFVVVNASNIETDVAWLRRQAAGLDCAVDDQSAGTAMVALQGPAAKEVIGAVCPEAAALKRMGGLEARLFGEPCVVTRTGYTGEDGFEVVAPNAVIPRVWQTLIVRGGSFGLLPCGLGARDTLRLEAGLLLHGNDVDADHTTLETGYDWVAKLDKPDFIGKAALQAQKKAGLTRRLTGLKLLERGVPRPGCKVYADGAEAGVLCSATYSPTLETGIGVYYAAAPFPPPGRALEVEIHGRRFPAATAPLPFYKSLSRS